MKLFLREWWVILVWVAAFVFCCFFAPSYAGLIFLLPVAVAIIIGAWRHTNGSHQIYHGDQDGN